MSSHGRDAEKNSLWHWLESAGLERFYNKFRALGVTEETFTELQFQEYATLGVTNSNDQQRLFKLIQTVHRETRAGAGGDSGSSAAARPKPKGSGLKAPKSYGGAPKPKASNKRPTSASSRDAGASKAPPPDEFEDDDFFFARAPSPQSGLLSDSPLEEEEPPPIDPSLESKIRVVVRKRPIAKSELQKGEKDIISCPLEKKELCIVHEFKQKVDLTKYVEKHPFMFDEVFSETADNTQIYERTCKPLVPFFFNRGKATCFAYGQTGSGKTFTMMGPGGGKHAQQGLYVLAARDIFGTLPSASQQYPGMEVHVSFFEIYGGKLFDLLNNRSKLVCREDGAKNVVVVGLREQRCESVEELVDLMAQGNQVRSTGRTGANDSSSRSHAILQIALKVPDSARRKRLKTHGKFSFIDLAGSERGADTMKTDRQTRIEGADINRSLLALKECIRALDQQKSHQPFRGSKLTQVLKDSFIGNSRTVMVANISPNHLSTEHTLNTLRYADRVKELRSEKKAKNSEEAYMPHQAKKNTEVKDVDDWNDFSDEDGADFLVPVEEPKPRSKKPGGSRSRSPSPLPGHDRQKSKEKSPPQHSQPPKIKSSASGSSKSSKRATKDVVLDEEAQTQDLLATHQQICAAILEEEDEIVESHRRHIDNTMKLVKDEMQLLKKFDQLAFSVDEYVNSLDNILAQKQKSIQDLRAKVATFRAHLQEEELLSASLKGGSLDLIGDDKDGNN